MKLLDPLQGFKIASKVVYLQLGLALTMTALFLIKEELDFSGRNNAIGIMFIVHWICYALETF